MQTPWDHRFAQRTQRMSSSAIRELLKAFRTARYYFVCRGHAGA